MTQQSHFWVHTYEDRKQELEERFAHLCSQQHRPPRPKGNSHCLLQTSRFRKCGPSGQGDIIQP